MRVSDTSPESNDTMPLQGTARIGKRGVLVIPAALRRRFGLEEGTLVIAEDRGDGILIRPARAVPVEVYTPERKAEFLRTNAVDEADYQWTRKEVQKMWLDPVTIPHNIPAYGRADRATTES